MKIRTIIRTGKKCLRLLGGAGAAAAIAMLMTGCNGAQNQPTPTMPPMVMPQAYTEPEERYANPGSLFNDATVANNSMFQDNRARNVGDIIHIKIVETSKSKSKVDTSNERKASSEYTVSAAFSRRRIMGTRLGADPMVATSSNNKNDATGETKRENYVSATLGGRVMQVMPNGVMQVAAYREIRVNNETQYMVVSGLVRSSDVDADNSVLSTQLADSRIDYYGKGDLADKQKTGWLTRLMDNLWPF